MPRPLPEKSLGLMLDAIGAAPAGCTQAELAARFTPKPPERNLQRWVAALVKQKRIVREGGGKFTRYRLAGGNDVPGDLAPGVQPFVIRKGSVEAAIERLVTRPLAERQPCPYHRAWLDAYETNGTWYLPQEIRDLLRSTPGVENGAAKLKDPKFLGRMIEDTAYTALRYEGERVTRETVTQFLAQKTPGKPGSRALRLALNQRDGFRHVAESTATHRIDGDALLVLADVVEDGFFARDEAGEPVVLDALRRGPWVPRDLGGVERAAGTPDSAYQPPSDPAVVRACFEQIAYKAEQILDPFESAFFLFVHLLYLQPFTFNVSTACLVANLRLLHDNLLPTAFVTIPARDFRIAMLGVCEVNQVDLLRAVFVQAYFDGLELPQGHPYYR